MDVIRIFLANSQDYIEASLKELISLPLNDVIKLLVGELAPLEIWYRLALTYYLHGKEENYELIVNIAINQRVEEFRGREDLKMIIGEEEERKFLSTWRDAMIDVEYRTSGYMRVLLMNSIAGMRAKQKDYEGAMKLYKMSDMVKKHWMTSVGRGMMIFEQDKKDRVKKCFDTALKEYETRLGRLGLVLYYVQNNEFFSALKEITKVIMSIYTCHMEPLWLMSGEDGKASSGDDEYDRVIDEYWDGYSGEWVLCGEYAALRPMLSLIWNHLRLPEMASRVLEYHVGEVNERCVVEGKGLKYPNRYESCLTWLGVLYYNGYCQGMMTSGLRRNEQLTHGLNQSVNLFKQAISINPKHSEAWVHLANITFVQQEYPAFCKFLSNNSNFFKYDNNSNPELVHFRTTMNYCTIASNHASNPKVMSYVFYILARVYHVCQKIDLALSHYSESVRHYPEFYLPHYALGQIYLSRGDFDMALESFLKVEKLSPGDSLEIKVMLGHAYSMRSDCSPSSSTYTQFQNISDKKNAVKYFDKCLKGNSNCAEILIEKAKVLEKLDISKSLDTYYTALELLWGNCTTTKKHEITTPDCQINSKIPPTTLLHNIGVLNIELKDCPVAIDSLLKALLFNVFSAVRIDEHVTILPNDPSFVLTHYDSSNIFFNYPPPTYKNLFSRLEIENIIYNGGMNARDLMDRAMAMTVENRVVFESDWTCYCSNLNTSLMLAAAYSEHFEFEKASRIYDRLLEIYPDLEDAILGKSRMKALMGDYQSAQVLLEGFIANLQSNSIQSPSSNKKNSPSNQKNSYSIRRVKLMLANLHVELKEYSKAQSLLEQVALLKFDVYAWTQLANLYLVAASMPGEKQLRYLKHACDLFCQTIKQHPGNYYAANGLGVVLSLRVAMMNMSGGNSSSSNMVNDITSNEIEALDAFNSVLEVDRGMPDVLINLGHLYSTMNDYRQAMRYYAMVLKFHGGFSNTVIQTSHVPLIYAKCLFESNDFIGAKNMLLRYLQVNPTDEDAWYNLAVISKDYALGILKRVTEKTPTNNNDSNGITGNASHVPSEEEQIDAIRSLRVAAPIFERLVNSTCKRSFNLNKCKKFAILCTTNRELAEEKLEQFRQDDAARKADALLTYAKIKEKEEEKKKTELAQKQALLHELETSQAIAKADQQLAQVYLTSWKEKNNPLPSTTTTTDPPSPTPTKKKKNNFQPSPIDDPLPTPQKITDTLNEIMKKREKRKHSQDDHTSSLSPPKKTAHDDGPININTDHHP